MRFLSTLLASVLGTLLAFGVVVFFLFFFFFALTLSADQTPTVPSGAVLEIPIEGPIPERLTDDPFQRAFQEGPSYDLQDLQTGLRNAASDDRIEAVWLRMKGTTAEWATLEEVRTAVDQARTRGVPVIASSEDFGMSEKDYFVASAADSVFVGPQAPFEYNGFTTIVTFFQNALQKLEVEPQVIRAGQFKSATEQFTRSDLSDPNRQQLTAVLETVNQQFTQAISDARERPPAALNHLAEEDALIDATRAQEEGLIDGLRHEDEVRTAFQRLLDQSTSEDLRTVSLNSYRRISPERVGRTYTGDGTVAVVHAQGNIVSGEPNENPLTPSSEVLGSTTLIEALEEARTSSSIDAVVLRVNSPGGSASASEAMWRAVERTAAEKPVIASMGDMAASGGYYIAAGADSIVANSTTVTGSIGVFGLLLNAQGLFEDKLGITFDDVSTSPYADMYSPTKPLASYERQLIGRSVERTYDTFLQRVAEGRRMDTSAVHEVAQGRIWSGEDAVEAGLVDTTGTLEDAISMAGSAAGLGEGPYRTRTLPRPKTLVERLNEQLATQASQVWRSLTTTELERTLWEQEQVLDRIVGSDGSIQARLPFDLTIE